MSMEECNKCNHLLLPVEEAILKSRETSDEFVKETQSYANQMNTCMDHGFRPSNYSELKHTSCHHGHSFHREGWSGQIHIHVCANQLFHHCHHHHHQVGFTIAIISLSLPLSLFVADYRKMSLNEPIFTNWAPLENNEQPTW